MSSHKLKSCRCCRYRLGYLPIGPSQTCPNPITTGFDACATCDKSSSTTAVVLDHGATTNCSFTGTVQGNAGDNITNKACVTGKDSNGSDVGPTCSTATISILDVGPTAAVTKTADKDLVCAVVRYKVEVQNTDTVDYLSLTGLSDNPFGSITTTHGTGDNAVLGTTCGVAATSAGLGTLSGSFGAGALCVAGQTCSTPAYIAPNGYYTCYYDAEFCAGQKANTVTATLRDGDSHCSSGALAEQPPSSGEIACVTDANCPAATPHCVPNEITKGGSVRVNVTVTGVCSITASKLCLEDVNCPAGEKCLFPF